MLGTKGGTKGYVTCSLSEELDNLTLLIFVRTDIVSGKQYS